MPASGGTKESFGRRTWGVRGGIYAAILIALIAGTLYVVTRSGGGGDIGGSSRFPAAHRFDTVDYHSLAVDPGGRLFFGHHNGVQQSTDSGESWEALIERPDWDAMSLAFDPFNADRVYMAGHSVYRISEDGGTSWQQPQSSLPALDLHAFAASPNEEGRLYAYAVGFGLYVSDDAGQDWALVSDDVPFGTSAVVELPDGAMLLAATDKGILRSEDAGKSWTSSRSGIDIGAIFT
ncbi:MAG: WD40/YVTN/BNR-like repeat-containing protein, partial [Dehalococcoidia bacterium]